MHWSFDNAAVWHEMGVLKTAEGAAEQAGVREFVLAFVQFWKPVAERTLAAIFLWLNERWTEQDVDKRCQIDPEAAEQLAARTADAVLDGLDGETAAYTSRQMKEHVVDVHARVAEAAYQHRTFHNQLLEERFCASCIKRLLRDRTPRSDRDVTSGWCRVARIAPGSCTKHFSALRERIEHSAALSRPPVVTSRGSSEDPTPLGIDDFVTRLNVFAVGAPAAVRALEVLTGAAGIGLVAMWSPPLAAFAGVDPPDPEIFQELAGPTGEQPAPLSPLPVMTTEPGPSSRPVSSLPTAAGGAEGGSAGPSSLRDPDFARMGDGPGVQVASSRHEPVGPGQDGPGVQVPSSVQEPPGPGHDGPGVPSPAALQLKKRTVTGIRHDLMAVLKSRGRKDCRTKLEGDFYDIFFESDSIVGPFPDDARARMARVARVLSAAMKDCP